MSAVLLGKTRGGNSVHLNVFARRAFALANEYLPDSNFLFTGLRTLCTSENVKFYNGNISGACIGNIGGACVNDGCTYVQLYSYRVPCRECDLFIYVGDYQYYYVTMKCFDGDTEYYVEFTFEREMGIPFNKANIENIAEEEI